MIRPLEPEDLRAFAQRVVRLFLGGLSVGVLALAVSHTARQMGAPYVHGRPLRDAAEAPVDLAAGPAGEVIVARQGDTVADLLRFAVDLQPTAHFMAWVVAPSVAVDANGHIYVAGAVDFLPIRERVEIFDADGVHLGRWSVRDDHHLDLDGTNDGGIVGMHGEQLNCHRSLRCDEPIKEILRYTPDGRDTHAWSVPATGNAIAVGLAGELFLARNEANEGAVVERYDAAGERLGDFAVDGRTIGMDMGPAGSLFVASLADSGPPFVTKYQLDGDLVRRIDRWPICDNARALAVTSDGRIIIAAVETGDPWGRLCTYNEEGESLAELRLPDHTGRVAPTVTPPPTATPDLKVRAWVPITIKRR
jgi:hypothetical protein